MGSTISITPPSPHMARYLDLFFTSREDDAEWAVYESLKTCLKAILEPKFPDITEREIINTVKFHLLVFARYAKWHLEDDFLAVPIPTHYPSYKFPHAPKTSSPHHPLDESWGCDESRIMTVDRPSALLTVLLPLFQDYLVTRYVQTFHDPTVDPYDRAIEISLSTGQRFKLVVTPRSAVIRLKERLMHRAQYLSDLRGFFPRHKDDLRRLAYSTYLYELAGPALLIDHQWFITVSHAETLLRERRFEESRKAWKRALKLAKRMRACVWRSTLYSTAILYAAAGKLDRMISVFRKVAAIYQKRRPLHSLVLYANGGLISGLDEKASNDPSFKTRYDALIAESTRRFGPTAIFTLINRENRIFPLLAENPAEAMEEAENVLRQCLRTLGPYNIHTARVFDLIKYCSSQGAFRLSLANLIFQVYCRTKYRYISCLADMAKQHVKTLEEKGNVGHARYCAYIYVLHPPSKAKARVI